MRHGMQRKKNRAELFGELVMREQGKWRSHAIKFGALESEADDVISDSLAYLYSRPELEWTERLMSVTIKCRAKNRRRSRPTNPIGLIEDLTSSHQHYIIKDHEMGVDDRMEYEELYAQAVEDVRQSKGARYAEFLIRVCSDPQTPIVKKGVEMGMLENTASGVMWRIKRYLKEKEADYGKA
jgi:hypothetical protein